MPRLVYYRKEDSNSWNNYLFQSQLDDREHKKDNPSKRYECAYCRLLKNKPEIILIFVQTDAGQILPSWKHANSFRICL